MITRFDNYNYNLITECNYFNVNNDILEHCRRHGIISPEFLIDESVNYINGINDILNDYSSENILLITQIKYIKEHMFDSQTIIGKFFGDEWWSKFLNAGELNWTPDKYLVKTHTPRYMLSSEERKKKFITENKKEEREQRQKKEETKYLSKSERKKLTPIQRRTLVYKRKEMGTWNDADLQQESIRSLMTPKSKEELELVYNKFKDNGTVKKYEDVIGKILKNVTVNDSGVDSGDDQILFDFEDGERYKMFHPQDCCESVVIEDVNGDIKDLIGEPLLIAEEIVSDDTSATESGTWSFYKFATIKGYVDIRWYGISNGYYSESVHFKKQNIN